jgi:uncharacterized protein YgbK (DUF1537 family)
VSAHVLSDANFAKQIRTALPKHNGNALATVRADLKNRAVSINEHRQVVTRICLDLHLVDATAPLVFKTYEQSDSTGRKRLLQHATADVVGKKIQLLLPEGPQSQRLVLDISDSDGCRHGTQNRGAA